MAARLSCVSIWRIGLAENRPDRRMARAARRALRASDRLVEVPRGGQAR